MALNVEEFAVNPDPRCACVLLLDTSGSMNGAPIDALNEGLKAFQQDIQEDPLAKRRVEIAIVTFGRSVQQVQDFVTAGSFVPPHLTAEGVTPMGEAITLGLELVKNRKAEYNAVGALYYRPWVLLITDGGPSDEWRGAAQAVQSAVSANALTFFAVGVGDAADMQILSAITPRATKLDGLRFKDLFVWLSQSQKRVSETEPGAMARLPAIDFNAPI